MRIKKEKYKNSSFNKNKNKFLKENASKPYRKKEKIAVIFDEKERS